LDHLLNFPVLVYFIVKNLATLEQSSSNEIDFLSFSSKGNNVLRKC
jgi:hypothetical protein